MRAVLAVISVLHVFGRIHNTKGEDWRATYRHGQKKRLHTGALGILRTATCSFHTRAESDLTLTLNSGDGGVESF